MIEIVLANARELVTELQSEGRGIILIMIAMGWFLSLGVRMVYPALLPRIRITYGMTLTTAGALLTTLWLAYAFGQLPAGMLADRVGEGRVMMVSTLVSAGTITLVVIAQSTILLFVATALFGLTTALYGVARFTSLSNLYPENDGAAIGLTMGAGDMGNAVLPPIAGFITAMLAWQFGFGMMIPMFLLAGIGIWIYVPMQTSGPAREFLTVAKARYVLSSISQPNILVIATIQVLIYCVWQALTGFYPTYLVEVKGFEATTAGILFGFFFSLGMVIKPLSGASYDRFDAKAPLRVLLVALLVALVILPFTTELWMVIAVTVPLSGVLGYSAITLPYMTGGIPEDIRNTGLGTLRTSYMAIGALSPTLVGSLADHDYFDEAFFLMAGLVVVALVVSLRVPEK